MIRALAAAADFVTPRVDYHALAPEIVLAAGICALILVDLFVSPAKRWILSSLAGLFLLAATIPVVTLGVIGDDVRSMFDGRYVIDPFSLVMKALFLLAAYIVVLMSVHNERDTNDYPGEYFTLLLTSTLGMVMMCSARDLVSVFVALEFLSIPSFMLAAWRKRDRKSNEAGMKYFLLAVFSSAVMLYGMSLLYGVTGTTKLAEIGQSITGKGAMVGVQVLGIVFVIVGFAFKVSAVPFHSWAPDVYEGAPTPITAYLSVSSKAAGFVALVLMVYLAFPAATDTYEPFLAVLSILTMTIGNLLALRQRNIVRMLAYSSISQGGFILMALAVAGSGDAEVSLRAVVVYLIIYAATNLGAFAVVIAVGRRTRSGMIASYSGLLSSSPGLTVAMTIFLASLAGIPPLGGWYAKFGAFKAVLEAGNAWGYTLAVVAAVNTVVSAAYYIIVMREMWMKDAPAGTVVGEPAPLARNLVAALVITAAATIAFGVLPGFSGYRALTDLAGVFTP